MRQWLIAIVLAVLGCNMVYAQVTGVVSTADGRPAAYATVLLYADSNTAATPSTYGLTTSDGHFTLATEPSDENYIVVRLLGCKEYRRRLGKERQLNIRLVADATRLGEVTIEASYMPVLVRGDTVEFNTDYYRTGAEESAAEVLKSIPGMEVSESGEVSFAGKAVDKVLIDGKDMFASGSDGALNTLPADAVRGAELLMHYKGGSLIDQFDGRNLTALNIKTDGKHRMAGRIGASAGLIGKAKADGSLLYMGNTLSLTSTIGANNTGEALFSLEDYIKTMVGLDNIISQGGQGFNPSQDELALMMPPNNVYDSKSGIAMLSGTWRPDERFKMKGNLLLNGTALDATSLSQQHFLALDALQEHKEESQSHSLFLTGHLQETWNPNDHIELSNLTQLTHTSLQSSDSLAENGISTLHALEHELLNKQQAKEEMALNAKLSSRSLLSAHLSFSHTQRNFSYHLLTNQALLPTALYSLNNDGEWQTDARRHITDIALQPDLSYAYNISRSLTLTTTAAFEHRSNDFRYDTTIDHSLGWNSLVGSLKLSRKRGLIQFNIGANLRHIQWHSTIEQLPDSGTVDLMPEGSISLVFSEVHRLSINGSMKRQPIELEHLLRDTLIGGYNHLLAGSDITSPFARTSDLQLNYYIFDLFSNTLFFAIAGVSDSRFAVRAHSSQEQSIASLSHYANDGSMRLLFANTSLRQGLGKHPWDITIATGLTHSTTSTSLNQIEGTMQSATYTGHLRLNSRRQSALNFDFGLNGSLQQSLYAETSNRLWEAGGNVAILVAWHHLTARLQFAYSHVEGGNYTRNLYDVGLRLEYSLGMWRLTLRGGNMLHLSGEEWASTISTPLYLATTLYRRLPGYLLAGAALRF